MNERFFLDKAIPSLTAFYPICGRTTCVPLVLFLGGGECVGGLYGGSIAYRVDEMDRCSSVLSGLIFGETILQVLER